MPGLARVFDPVIVGSRRWPAKQVIRSRPSSEASRPRRRRAAASARAMALVSTRLEGVEEVRETKIVVGDAVLPRKSHAHIDEAAHPGFQPPTHAARRRVQTRPTASAVLGGAVRYTPHPEPGNLMATLGRGLPRIVCVRLGSARQFSGLNVVRPLPPSGP